MNIFKRIIETDNTSETNCRLCYARKYCLMGDLNEQQKRNLERVIRYRKPLHQGDYLFMQGEEFSSLYQVRSGSFKSTIIDETGGRQITGFHFPGDILGLDGVCSGYHVYEIEALETSSVCGLPFYFPEIISDDEDELYHQLVHAVSYLEAQESHQLLVLDKMRAEQRLASFLLEISQRSSRRGDSEKKFNLSMARFDIANYLGLAVETLSRLFKRFHEYGLIDADRYSIRILDIQGLQDLVESDHKFSRFAQGSIDSLQSPWTGGLEEDLAVPTVLGNSFDHSALKLPPVCGYQVHPE